MPTNNNITDYVYLKNINGELIKPVTDLAAINLTTINGVAVQGNTIGVMSDYITSCYHSEMVEHTTAGEVTGDGLLPQS